MGLLGSEGSPLLRGLWPEAVHCKGWSSTWGFPCVPSQRTLRLEPSAPKSPSPAHPGTVEGDPEGAHTAGGGAALLHLLSGHAASDLGPAGPHPAWPAHRFLQVAKPHGPPWHCTRQVGFSQSLESPQHGAGCPWPRTAQGGWAVGKPCQHVNPLGGPLTLPSSPGTLCQASRLVCPELLFLP